ncbi:MAG TPA: hypothetical protein VE754_05170 [Actinomycetota bacterium]|jgi:hypothetical protein|nr:hypothetical protein [Actinomycetota bacterium]
MTKLLESGTRSVYAVLGAGEFLVGKARDLGRKSGELATRRRKEVVKWYEQMATRGEKVAGKVQRSQPAKRVADNAKQAQRQLKGAVTSVRKALGTEDTKPRTGTKKAS